MDSRQSDFFFFWKLTQSSHSSDLGIYVCSSTVVKTRQLCRFISHRGIISNFIHAWGQDREKGPQIHKAVKSCLLQLSGNVNSSLGSCFLCRQLRHTNHTHSGQLPEPKERLSRLILCFPKTTIFTVTQKSCTKCN